MKGDLTDVKAGDHVIQLRQTGFDRRLEEPVMLVVARATATQIVLDNGDKYHRSNNRKVGHKGGAWMSTPMVWPPTPENMAEAETLAARYREATNRTRWRNKILDALEKQGGFEKIPTDRLEAAYNALLDIGEDADR